MEAQKSIITIEYTRLITPAEEQAAWDDIGELRELAKKQIYMGCEVKK